MKLTSFSVRAQVLVWLVMIAGASSAWGQSTVTQTFDELAFQPIDGLSHAGVTFEYTLDGVNSTDAHYASYGPVTTEHVSDPSVVGNSRGVLTLNFAEPTPLLEFGLALNSADEVTSAVLVELYNAAGELADSETVDAPASAVALGFADLLYRYEGAPVSRAVLDFADKPGSFALDNLTYVVPEPSSMMMMLVVSLYGVLHGVRRRHVTTT